MKSAEDLRIEELMKQKLALEARLNKITTELRLEVYKTHIKNVNSSYPTFRG